MWIPGVAKRVIGDAVLGVGGLALGAGLFFVASGMATQDDPSPTADVIDVRVAVSGSGATTPGGAVGQFLDAEIAVDDVAAHRVLSAADRADHPTASLWGDRRRSVLGDIRSWRWSDEASLTTTVRFDPALSPTSGWTPAEASVQWAVVEEDGWRVSLDQSTVTPSLPAANRADESAQAWLADPRRCSNPAPERLVRHREASAAFSTLCESGGVLGRNSSQPVSGEIALDLALAYGGDPAAWARVVPIEGGLDLVLVAFGDAWIPIDAVAAT